MPLSAKIQKYVDERRITAEQASGLNEAQLRNLESDQIRGMIVDETLTFDQALGLNEDQFLNLDSVPISNLIANETLTLEQAMGLTDQQRYNLEPEGVRSLIANETLTLQQAMGLDVGQRWNLVQEAISSLIVNEKLTLQQAMGLTGQQRRNLVSEDIRSLIENETLTVEQAMGLTDQQRWNLGNTVIRSLIADETITIEQAMGLNQDQLRNLELNLESDAIRGMIVDEVLTLEQAIRLNARQRWLLESAAISSLIANETLTLEQAMGITDQQRMNLENPFIRSLIANETLTLQQVMGLTNQQSQNINYGAIISLIENETLTLQQAMELTKEQFWNLRSEAICSLIADETLTLEQAMGLTDRQHINLSSAAICSLIENETLTLEQAMGLTDRQRVNLNSEAIRSLIADETLTLQQAMGLDVDQRRALEDADTLQRLRNGDLTIQDMGIGIPHQNHDTPPPPPINDSQSTHTASVHRTVSESATRLMNRYANVMDPTALDQLITTITNEINALPAGNPKNEAAKRCVARLSAPDYAYVDRTSGVSTRELLALSWLAIHDDNARMGTALEDAKNLFIEGLYEIQRGYNLSATNIDLGASDRSICSAGTFNKLMEKLNRIHPDVDVKMITPGQFAWKLPRVLREEVINYLASKANPATTIELTQSTEQVKKIEEEVDEIWDAIKDKVSARLFDEFGSLYTNEHDPNFTAFIDTCLDGITPILADLKLPKVIREEVHNYLAGKASPGTMEELIQFTEQIKNLKEKGTASIWNAIEAKVSARIFAEFKELYQGKHDPKFTDFIATGANVVLGPLPSYQKQVSESEGYREYCRATMNSYRTMLNQNRQDSEPDLGEDEQTQLK